MTRSLVTALLLVAPLAHAGDAPTGTPPTRATVASVYDGDTVTLDTGDKIRLRWVNTPELRPAEDFGIEAREATKAFVLNKEVELTFDAENPRDGYGRVVAGLKTSEGDLSVHLAERGLGHVFVIPPDDTDLTELIAAQGRARQARLGIWTLDAYQGPLHITSFHANGRGDDAKFVNGEYLRVCNVSAVPVDLSAYTLTDDDGNKYPLPPVTIPAGHTVKIHSGKGRDQNDPTKQIEAYLQSDTPVWDNDGDTATLVDAKGNRVDQRVHEVKGR